MKAEVPLEVEIASKEPPHIQEILTPQALEFLMALHRHFNDRRRDLVKHRQVMQKVLDGGGTLSYLHETETIRNDPNWQVASSPRDLVERRVEITGPVERKMMINAFNSGADVFMADFEDALSPTWKNVIEGQANLIEAVRGTLSFTSPEGKQYALGAKIATLMVRPRGWHLDEKHLKFNHELMSASLFDFGLFFFHNAKALIDKGSGPYFYLPKLENHLEAKLWNEIFCFAQDWLKIPRGTIRATVLIETIPAAFQMEEILFELKEHSAGLNAGRWDYLFSIIKRFCKHRDLIFPDRGQVTMNVPFMQAYATSLVRTCHKRKAHAMGGMAAFIPSRKDPQINAIALSKVKEDKQREVKQGFDGTWVAHPDLVPVALEVFKEGLKGKPNQIDFIPASHSISAGDLLNFAVPNGKITEAGVKQNLNVAIQYLSAWLSGNGAVAIANLMEDAATAEISRAQLWQWIHHHDARLDDGRKISLSQIEQWGLEERLKAGGVGQNHLDQAWVLLHDLISRQDFVEFLTIPAYQELKENVY